MRKFNFLSKDKIGRLPKTAGVYCFKDKKHLLYIGKATDIKKRIKQHKDLLGSATKAGYIKTNSEIEALILEANLIKKYQPKYNILWKDDKNYFYVAITKEDRDFPVISITHQPKLAENSPLPIGPFVGGRALKKTLTYLRKVFPYYSAKKHPKGSCLWCDLKLCPGPNPLKSEYQKNIKNLISVLKGNSKKVLNDLKRAMNQFSACQEYEKAAKIRNQITALERVLAHFKIFSEAVDVKHQQRKNWQALQKILQKILKIKRVISRIEAYDVSNIQGKTATGAMVTFIDGKPDKNFYRRFKIKTKDKPNDVAMLKEILSRRLKHPEWPYPDLILIDGGIGQLSAVLKVKNQKSKVKSTIQKSKVIALAKKNNILFVEGRKKPILLKNLAREIFNLILQLRDEAHRFAIFYHRKLRNKILSKKIKNSKAPKEWSGGLDNPPV